METNELDRTLVDELVLCIENDGEFYRQTSAVRRNFARKLAKGVFDRSLAIPFLVKQWLPIAFVNYAKYYADKAFTRAIGKTERVAIAEGLLDGWMEEIEDKAEELKALKSNKQEA